MQAGNASARLSDFCFFTITNQKQASMLCDCLGMTQGAFLYLLPKNDAPERNG